MAHHPAASRGEHQEESAEKLGEQTSPLLARILEVFDPVDDLLLVTRDQALRRASGVTELGAAAIEAPLVAITGADSSKPLASSPSA